MIDQQIRTARARWVAGLAIAALLGVGVMGLGDPGPTRMACSGNITTNVLMSSGRADFGGDPHLAGTPTTPGRICWSTVVPRGAILEGQLYYDDLFSAGCAHINVEFRTSATGQLVSRYINSVCSPGGLRQKSVFSQVNGNVRSITIRLFRSETARGAQTPVGTRRFGI